MLSRETNLKTFLESVAQDRRALRNEVLTGNISRTVTPTPGEVNETQIHLRNEFNTASICLAVRLLH